MYKEHCMLMALSMMAVMEAIYLLHNPIHVCDEAFLGGGANGGVLF